MGLFDIFRRKKDEELDFDAIAQKELGTMPEQPDLLNTSPSGMEEEKSIFDTTPEEPMPARFPGATPAARPTNRGMSQETPQMMNRDLELINSKLDTIKALLTSMEQRIANVERSTGSQTPQQRQRLW